MSLRKGSFHSPRIKNVKRYKTLQKQNRYKKSKFSENVRYCSWKGKNGMYAADVVVSGNGTSRRKTIGYYEKETEALEARVQYYKNLEERKLHLQHLKEFPELYISNNNNKSMKRNNNNGKKNDNNNNFDEKSDDTPIPTSPRALLRMGISPRGNNTNKYNYNMKNKRRDSHMMIGLPQGYRDSTHSKKDLENLSFKRFHRKRHDNNIIPDMMKAQLHRDTRKKWLKQNNEEHEAVPYYPLYRKETNNINMHLLEKHQKLLRERTITKTYNNVFRRQHAWHPYTFKMRERHERHHGHEGEIDDKSVPSKHKNYVRNHSHVNIFQPNEMQDHEIYHENLIRKMKGKKLKLGDTRVIHPHDPRGCTPPTAWPNGSNRSGRLDYEKLKGYN